MALDLDRSATRPAEEAETPPGVSETFLHSQDIKCFHCGFVSGQLVGPPGVPRGARDFIPSPELPTSHVIHPGRPRCARCGGPCFLDEIETRIRLSEEVLERPRRGRKPKARPAPA
jgi:hypothetical protein